jgi:hypothetical protein
VINVFTCHPVRDRVGIMTVSHLNVWVTRDLRSVVARLSTV